jgi:hypothetical protein
MKSLRSVQALVERALAFAHAALDEESPRRVSEAKMYAAQVLPYLGKTKPEAATLGEARHFLVLVGQLRAVLEVLDKKLALAPLPRPN